MFLPFLLFLYRWSNSLINSKSTMCVYILGQFSMHHDSANMTRFIRYTSIQFVSRVLNFQLPESIYQILREVGHIEPKWTMVSCHEVSGAATPELGGHWNSEMLLG